VRQNEGNLSCVFLFSGGTWRIFLGRDDAFLPVRSAGGLGGNPKFEGRAQEKKRREQRGKRHLLTQAPYTGKTGEWERVTLG